MPENSSYAEFLDRVRDCNSHLKYGQIVWDGEERQVVTSIHFELSRQEPAEVVNFRAYDFFSKLDPQDYLALRIEVDVRAGRAVRAMLKPRDGCGVVRTGMTGRLKHLVSGLDLQPE
jgi:hypothetical protein